MERDLEKLLIGPQTSIREAVQSIANGLEKIVLVVDEDKRLRGTFVDGDMRRALLKGKSLDSPVKDVMQSSPKVCRLDDVNLREKAKELMLEYKLEQIPVVNSDNVVVGIFFWRDFFEIGQTRDVSHKVFIMAGGKGTRLEPFTRVLPKPLIPLEDKPIIHHIMERFSRYGFQNFILSLNYKAEMIRLYFADNFSDWGIEYVVENEPLDTAGSLSLAKERLKDTFFVTNCDIIIDEDFSRLLSYHKEKKNLITIVVSQKDIVVPYGVMDVLEDGQLSSIREKPRFNVLVNTGLYVLEPDVLNILPKNKAFSMVKLIEQAREKGMRVGVFPIEEKNWFDIGQWAEYKNTLKHFAQELI